MSGVPASLLCACPGMSTEMAHTMALGQHISATWVARYAAERGKCLLRSQIVVLFCSVPSQHFMSGRHTVWAISHSRSPFGKALLDLLIPPCCSTALGCRARQCRQAAPGSQHHFQHSLSPDPCCACIPTPNNPVLM